MTQPTSQGFFDSSDTRAINYEIQNMLYYISFFDKNITRVYPDGIYGERTRLAVTEFQQQSGIEQTGQVNYETWVRLRERYTVLSDRNAPPSRLAIFPSSVYETQTGEKSGIILVIQILLDDISGHIGIEGVERTGVNDEQTMNAVSEYQRIRNLPQTGLVDKRTWDALANDYELFDKKSE